MKPYNPKEFETTWQERWEAEKMFHAEDFAKKPKFYDLVEFPYPSGEGLHMGHLRSYTAMDVIARKRRMDGYNVLFPIGFDAFGLPAENFAIKTGVHPRITTLRNIDTFTRQLKSLGYSFDWSRMVNTTDPAYYRWTQWIFLKLFEHGLAYKTEAPTNWCTSCCVTLANEEVVAERCERCGNEVIRKIKKQWLLKITAYAEKLLAGLEEVDFLEIIKEQQRNWIGRSEGAEIYFSLKSGTDQIKVFTTRPDTLFGVTYMVIAPEHPLLELARARIENWDEVEQYCVAVLKMSDLERQEGKKEKTGVELRGIKALHPMNGRELPVFVADYVLASYGFGAVMAVPAHDQRDFEFAKRYELPIIHVISGALGESRVYEGNGTLIHSDGFDGLENTIAKKKIIDLLTEQGKGEATVHYKLRDWVFSRQRYWGEPIPIIECVACGFVPVPEDQLPVLLPELPNYQPSATGESPLVHIPEWVNVACPQCGGSAKRETDTMPQWAGSSWYFLRYVDPHQNTAIATMNKMQYWFPVDWYNGGAEHITLHLLYSRFWSKFLYDIGVTPSSEPYQKRTLQGMILGVGGIKMSKSRGNAVNPDQYVEEFGADATRLYILFIGPFDQAIVWDHQGVIGIRRFLEKVWGLRLKVQNRSSIQSETGAEVQVSTRLLHKTIKKVTADIEAMRFNTAISALMILVNELNNQESIDMETMKIVLRLLSPFAPHMADELGEQLGAKDLISKEPWPHYDEQLTRDDEIELVIQINGKVRHRLSVAADITEDALKPMVLAEQDVNRWIADKPIKKFIYIRGRIVSIVV